MTKQAVSNMYPCSIESTKADQQRAKVILAADNNYIVRYLRHQPTVGLAKLPARNTDGAVIEDAPRILKRVICSGIPYACMVAFMYQEKLLIGWSKRLETRHLMETTELHGLFRHLLENTKGVDEHSANYQGAFDAFTNSLISFLTCQRTKDVEIAFSKTFGKTTAIIRGLNDSIITNGNFMESAASGAIPHELAKTLPQFIAYAEQTYGGKAANVGNPDTMPAIGTTTAVAVG